MRWAASRTRCAATSSSLAKDAASPVPRGAGLFVWCAMSRREISAGILPFRRRGAVELLLAHPGGPHWAKKDAGERVHDLAALLLHRRQGDERRLRHKAGLLGEFAQRRRQQLFAR